MHSGLTSFNMEVVRETINCKTSTQVFKKSRNVLEKEGRVEKVVIYKWKPHKLKIKIVRFYFVQFGFRQGYDVWDSRKVSKKNYSKFHISPFIIYIISISSLSKQLSYRVK